MRASPTHTNIRGRAGRTFAELTACDYSERDRDRDRRRDLRDEIVALLKRERRGMSLAEIHKETGASCAAIGGTVARFPSYLQSERTSAIRHRPKSPSCMVYLHPHLQELAS